MEGQRQQALLQQAKQLAEQGRHVDAALLMARAGKAQEAAQWLADSGLHAEAARLLLGALGRPFEQFGELSPQHQGLARQAASWFVEAQQFQMAVAIYLGLNEAESARRCYDASLELLQRQPTYTPEYRTFAADTIQCAFRCGEIDFELDFALQDFAETGPLNLDEAKLFSMLATLYEKHEQFENAQELLERAAKRFPQFAQVKEQLGAIRRLRKGAESDYERVLNEQREFRGDALPNVDLSLSFDDLPGLPDLPPLPPLPASGANGTPASGPFPGAHPSSTPRPRAARSGSLPHPLSGSSPQFPHETGSASGWSAPQQGRPGAVQTPPHGVPPHGRPPHPGRDPYGPPSHHHSSRPMPNPWAAGRDESQPTSSWRPPPGAESGGFATEPAPHHRSRPLPYPGPTPGHPGGTGRTTPHGAGSSMSRDAQQAYQTQSQSRPLPSPHEHARSRPLPSPHASSRPLPSPHDHASSRPLPSPHDQHRSRPLPSPHGASGPPVRGRRPTSPSLSRVPMVRGQEVSPTNYPSSGAMQRPPQASFGHQRNAQGFAPPAEAYRATFPEAFNHTPSRHTPPSQPPRGPSQSPHTGHVIGGPSRPGGPGSAPGTSPDVVAAPYTRAKTDTDPKVQLPVPPEQLDPGTVFADRYELIESIGRGGMAVVFRAFDMLLQEEVALKVFSPFGADESSLRRFKQELRLSRRLSHPNIAKLFDIGHDMGYFYISMELLLGNSLERCIHDPALQFHHRLQFLLQASEGLAYAHEHEVIHRDVKSSNIFITNEGQAKLLDFGLAKVQKAPSLTDSRTILGTALYISPEQIRDFRTISPVSDLYSLGIVAFELFTGRLPFVHDELIPLLMMQIEQPSPSPRAFNPHLPPELEGLILRLLNKEPSQRYTNARQLSAHLKQLLSKL